MPSNISLWYIKKKNNGCYLAEPSKSNTSDVLSDSRSNEGFLIKPKSMQCGVTVVECKSRLNFVIKINKYQNRKSECQSLI